MSHFTASLFRLNRYLNILSQTAPYPHARLEALRIIKQHNPITLRKLCQMQQVSMPTMSKLVDELQNQGLVIRAQSKDDARQRLIVPTQKGVQQLAVMETENNQFWEQKLINLNATEQQLMVEMLEKINALIKPE
ncbi:MarR family winged helix-turn-helix transcriptional regulator [Aliikangiella maris]|uniref:MarR family transcriptional regulator n=2 Tax=Aliikangiella maris TaxID=3162458 RepID=A0ABV2BX89_9GAMM